MKVDLSSDGVLCISAETEIESYALKKWFENYGERNQCDSVLKVETKLIENDNTRT